MRPNTIEMTKKTANEIKTAGINVLLARSVSIEPKGQMAEMVLYPNALSVPVPVWKAKPTSANTINKEIESVRNDDDLIGFIVKLLCER